MNGIFLKMVSTFIFFLFFLPTASPAEGNALGPPKEEAVQSVESHYQALADLTAKVVQKNHLKTLGKTQIFEGTLYIKKPGRLRLDYTNGQTIVLDGKTGWFYSKKSQQAIKRTFSEIEQANVPVAFLLGASKISKEFDILQVKNHGARTLDLSPKKPGAAMRKIRLKADDAGRITDMTIFDRSGNTTEITFSDVKEGIGIKDQLFEFKVPKGTEIIEQ